MKLFAIPRQLNEADETLRHEILTSLRSAQNADGGWGFHAGAQSRVEPTCWAARAILDSQKNTDSEAVRKLIGFLRSKQLPDGSWPTTDGTDSGSWVTSHACALLARIPDCKKAVEAGLQWLCDDYPRDSSPWRKFLKKFQTDTHIVTHNDSYRGWGWTPRTSSWVEPTAFALIAFGQAQSVGLAASISERRQLAISLLYDRMCPGGGWNCGNPRVYGVDGDALVLPTCWVLLALRDSPEHPSRALGIAWLQQALPQIETAGSLAIARVTLENYGIEPPAAKRNLSFWSVQEIVEQGAHVMAWVSMALNNDRHWPSVFARNSAQDGLEAAQ
jgi:Prenyltransferase and squalene oxidase repeat